MTIKFDSFERNTRLLNLRPHTAQHTASEGNEEEHRNFQENVIFHSNYVLLNTLRTGSFKLFKRPLPGFLIILTL